MIPGSIYWKNEADEYEAIYAKYAQNDLANVIVSYYLHMKHFFIYINKVCLYEPSKKWQQESTNF
jgi:hypothetical protein